jgi:MYXO-CTERM domain-containing protein
VVGLDHTCDDGMLDPPPVDHTGAELPNCYPVLQLDPAIRQATMFNFAEPGEIDKRTLEPDDQAGICALFPLAQDPGRCEPVPPIAPRTCATGPAAPAPGQLLLWLLVLGFLAVRAHRRR